MSVFLMFNKDRCFSLCIELLGIPLTMPLEYKLSKFLSSSDSETKEAYDYY